MVAKRNKDGMALKSDELDQEGIARITELRKRIELLKSLISDLDDENDEMNQIINAEQDPKKKAHLVAGRDSARRDLQRELSQINKEIVFFQTSDGKPRNFNKAIALRNIRDMAKEKDVKIGYIEQQAHVQIGYMSRLEKEGSTTEPSVEFLVTAAKLLETTVDSLISDRKKTNATEMYLLSFVQKLISDTTVDKLRWVTEFSNELICECNYPSEDNNHPLLRYFVRQYGDGDIEIPTAEFISNTFRDHTYIAGDWFKTKISSATLYVVVVTGGEESADAIVEMWMIRDDGKKQFLCSATDDTPLSNSMDFLYELLTEGAKHPKIEEGILSAIDAYMAK